MAKIDDPIEIPNISLELGLLEGLRGDIRDRNLYPLAPYAWLATTQLGAFTILANLAASLTEDMEPVISRLDEGFAMAIATNTSPAIPPTENMRAYSEAIEYTNELLRERGEPYSLAYPASTEQPATGQDSIDASESNVA
jgi:hypothetical protein